MNLTLQELNTMLYGLTKEEARKIIKRHGGSSRVFIENDVEFYGDTAIDRKRVNLEVKNGKVVGVLDIG